MVASWILGERSVHWLCRPPRELAQVGFFRPAPLRLVNAGLTRHCDRDSGPTHVLR